MPIVNTKKMLQKAYDEGYAVGAFNVNNMEIIQGITRACMELNSPVILQVSSGAYKYAGDNYIKKLVEAADKETHVNMALHLDHGNSFALCKECIDSGFSSVMIDGSHLSYEENVQITKKVVDYAHKYGVSVEGELGRLAGMEDDINVPQESSLCTDPLQAKDFAQQTQVDSLAIAIGTSHGAYKFSAKHEPKLRFDILQKIQEIIPNLPIVLHGASSVPREFVEDINKFGGSLEDTVGIPESMLRQASQMAVCKINVDTDIRLAMTAAVREYLWENTKEFDPRKYLFPARDSIENLVKHKIKHVFGCQNKG